MTLSRSCLLLMFPITLALGCSDSLGDDEVDSSVGTSDRETGATDGVGGSPGGGAGTGGDGVGGTSTGGAETAGSGTGGFPGVGTPEWPDDCTPPDGFTVVSSIAELKPYLDDDDVQVALAEGTYRLNGDDVDSGLIPDRILLEISGDGNVFDFTCAKIEFDTELFQEDSYDDGTIELRIVGSENVVRNLHMEDIGDVYEWPHHGALAVQLDGRDNLLEGVHMTLRGSRPYGYGDVFGKGGSPNTMAHKKHSAIQLRGLRNRVLNTTIIHRAYGHAIFMQAAHDAHVEGCYIEGEVRSTDDILAEEGTGSAADDIDFETVFNKDVDSGTPGDRLYPGFTLSLQEEGIRAYNGGETWIDGDYFERGTHNVTVLNNVVKNMRGGVTIGHATGTRYVEGTTAVGCERGFAVGSGEIVDSFADAAHGPVIGMDYSSDRGTTADITILPSVEGKNGSGTLAYLGGSSHDITLRSSDGTGSPGLVIKISGEKDGLRFQNGSLSHQNNLTSSNITLENLTEYPVILHTDASDCDVVSDGPVTDDGSDNSVAEN